MPSPMPSTNLVVRLDAWLPQTQCTRCGYPGCRAYAEALAAGDTDINRCPPGGDVTLRALARLLGVVSPSRSIPPVAHRHRARVR